MTFHTKDLPGAAFFPSGNDEQNHSAIGHAVHSYLAALPSMTATGESHKLMVAERCLQAHCVSGFIPASVLVAAGDRFCNWVNASYPNAVWHAEVPVSGPRSDGGTWVGAVDLILQLNETEIVLVDHKSAPLRREHCAKKAAEFEGQTTAYSEMLQGMGITIRAALIHFPLAGTVVQAQFNYTDD
ncbi:MAG: PD-(D/E)XK nuclease family protein [Planctomyces sp.]